MLNQSRRRIVSSSILLLVFVIALLASSQALAQDTGGQGFPPPQNTEWGQLVALGNGAIQTFVTVEPSGQPAMVGVYFTAGALSGLPTTPSDGRWDVVDAAGKVVTPCCGHEVAVDFPATIAATPFKHFVLNWNPMGHIPAGVYDKPHFDLHFYTIINEERMAIPVATADTMCVVPNPPGTPGEHPVDVSCETFEQGMLPLPEKQAPPGYVAVGAVEPGMGNHLINPAAPEFSGEPFTHTWIYGTYGGKLTFLEPMIANAFLEEKNAETCAALTLPEEMPEPGYYPTQYCIRYLANQDAFTVTLESFVEY